MFKKEKGRIASHTATHTRIFYQVFVVQFKAWDTQYKIHTVNITKR
jgi:hypothetical protein